MEAYTICPSKEAEGGENNISCNPVRAETINSRLPRKNLTHG
jgi:hypothetical protein